ncbi:hypothetical protein [Naumannella halotolerans]|uniref:Copper(I)-binding protein n=1 Tax=Naumannella halotolerans TaxID=993414 RepID=A0A4V3EMH1_9ACTN|nr:hypothetical protein [Naumannella halotolerans]TDT30038.1 hypothetical protein CLV29_3061 [Naumannella halotolerans]
MTSSPSRIAQATAAAALAIACSVGFAACTQDPARLPPTIGGGVNAEVGEQDPVKVLNLMLITRDGTTGFLEGALSTTGEDTLVSVSGELVDADNNPTGTPLVFEGGPTPVVTKQLSKLSVGNPYLVSGEIPVGLTVRTTLVFTHAGEVTLDVPIVDGNNVDYATVTPQPTNL